MRGVHNASEAKGREQNEYYVSHFVAPHKGINESCVCRSFTKRSWMTATIELIKPVNPQPDVLMGYLFITIIIFFYILSIYI